jgi:hypothetical protein
MKAESSWRREIKPLISNITNVTLRTFDDTDSAKSTGATAHKVTVTDENAGAVGRDS